MFGDVSSHESLASCPGNPGGYLLRTERPQAWQVERYQRRLLGEVPPDQEGKSDRQEWIDPAGLPHSVPGGTGARSGHWRRTRKGMIHQASGADLSVSAGKLGCQKIEHGPDAQTGV